MTCFLNLLCILSLVSEEAPSSQEKAGPDVGVYLKLRSLFLCFPLLLHFTIIPVPRKYTHAIHWLLFISQKGHSVCDVWNLGESSFHSLLSSLDGCSVSVLLGPLAFLL